MSNVDLTATLLTLNFRGLPSDNDRPEGVSSPGELSPLWARDDGEGGLTGVDLKMGMTRQHESHPPRGWVAGRGFDP